MTTHFFFLMIRRPPRSTQSRSSAASDVYKRQFFVCLNNILNGITSHENMIDSWHDIKQRAILSDTGYSEAEFLEFSSNVLEGWEIFGLSSEVDLFEFSFEESLCSGFSLFFKSINQIAVVPTLSAHEFAKSAVWSEVSKSELSDGIWYDSLLSVIVWWWASFENFKSSQCLCSSFSFVWNHTSNGSPNNTTWGSVMVWTSSWVSVHSLSQEIFPLQFVSEEGTGFTNLFTSYDNDSLSAQQFFGYARSQSTYQMIFAVNDYFLVKHFFPSNFNYYPHVLCVDTLSLIHISEPTRLLSISYAVFCLKKKKK
eukprot:TRINITY_DN1301_c0_g2_i1.p1 TRINITY_DN1301_c0_g2~~TRINITY_DN1301_c0_g2_i1.p1  ORF type:complete len:311 (-),score=58.99 TRINITY_DN1301_c0_g2_i1:10-942(-)